MKIGVVVVNRNDGYKDFERGLIHFKSMLDTFDEITYIDWNSPKGSFLWEIQDQLPKTGKIKPLFLRLMFLDYHHTEKEFKRTCFRVIHIDITRGKQSLAWA